MSETTDINEKCKYTINGIEYNQVSTPKIDLILSLLAKIELNTRKV